MVGSPSAVGRTASGRGGGASLTGRCDRGPAGLRQERTPAPAPPGRRRRRCWSPPTGPLRAAPRRRGGRRARRGRGRARVRGGGPACARPLAEGAVAHLVEVADQARHPFDLPAHHGQGRGHLDGLLDGAVLERRCGGLEAGQGRAQVVGHPGHQLTSGLGQGGRAVRTRAVRVLDRGQLGPEGVGPRPVHDRGGGHHDEGGDHAAGEHEAEQVVGGHGADDGQREGQGDAHAGERHGGDDGGCAIDLGQGVLLGRGPPATPGSSPRACRLGRRSVGVHAAEGTDLPGEGSPTHVGVSPIVRIPCGRVPTGAERGRGEVAATAVGLDRSLRTRRRSGPSRRRSPPRWRTRAGRRPGPVTR